MTLEELKENWEEYAFSDGKNTVPLQEIFAVCWGECKGGLLFDEGGSQGAPAAILKSDDKDNCYIKTDWHAPDEEAWKLIGYFVKIEKEQGYEE